MESIKSTELKFQIVNWYQYDEFDDEGMQSYTIVVFGRTDDGKDTCIRITDFKPYFYVKYPQEWNAWKIKGYISQVKKSVSNYTSKRVDRFGGDLGESLERYSIVSKIDFYNFSNNKKEKFIKVQFSSQTAMNAFKMAFEWTKEHKEDNSIKLYESKVEPFIRFIHTQDIEPFGWVSVDLKKCIEDSDYSNCDYSYSSHWKNVKSIKNDKIAPLVILGYDIECVSCDHNFPQAQRGSDEIIQIGMTKYRFGSMICEESYILCLGKCDEIKGSTVLCYETEDELLLGYAKMITELRPDIIVGYNNCDFDDRYIRDRIEFLESNRGCKNLMKKFLIAMGKLNNEYFINTLGLSKSPTVFAVKPISSSAIGDVELKFFDAPGILTIDMMSVIQRNFSLESFKLDSVAAVFIKEDIISMKKNKNTIEITTRSTKGLDEESYIQIMVNDGYSPSPFKKDVKYFVKSIRPSEDKKNQVICTEINEEDWIELEDLMNDKTIKLFWTFAKDDMHHTLINKYYSEKNASKVAIVAKYCIKDCKLVNLLITKLEIIVNSVGMANVCSVPFSYLITRGQGPKIFSLVVKECTQEGYLIPKLITPENREDIYYEGALVINPKPGVYLSPISVLDFNALYPKSMCQCNLSPECYVNDERYENLKNYIYHDIYIKKKTKDGKLIKDSNGNQLILHHKFAQEIVSEEQVEKEMEDVVKKLTDNNDLIIEKMIRDGVPENKITEQKKSLMKKINDEKMKKFNTVRGQTVRYGILPRIIAKLLAARKEVNARLALEEDPDVKAILNGRQLALKITVNSLYGQTGAAVSSIFFLPVAESTTAIGRERLMNAKDIVESNFPGSEIIYGDTDSIFINFHVKDADGKETNDINALSKSIELAKQAANKINSLVPSPQCIVYEKTFFPMVLFSMKKYSGIMYGDDVNKSSLKAMGIVLKRRDNPPIVKIAVGSILNIILKEKNIVAAIKAFNNVMDKMINDEYSIDKFVLSKKLRAKYDDPKIVAHKVLADRMGERDPGSKPSINDRVPFVYIFKRINKKACDILQGEVVEHPDYVKQHKLKIDYLYYLEHQIINPVSQLLELMLPKRIIDKIFTAVINKEKNKRTSTIDNWMDNYNEPTIDFQKHIAIERPVKEEMKRFIMTNSGETNTNEEAGKNKRIVSRKPKIKTNTSITEWI